MSAAPSYGSISSTHKVIPASARFAEDGSPQAAFGQPEHLAGNWSAFVGVLCVFAGTGTLGIPAALKMAGWFGLVILLVAALMAVYCGRLLIKCLYYKEGVRLQGFPEIAAASFGTFGKYFVGFFYNSILLGGPIIYLILAGTNMHQLLLPQGITLSVEQWIAILAALLLPPLIFSKTMKEATLLSLFGAFATGLVVVVVFVFSFVDYANGHRSTGGHKFIDPPHIPTALGTFAFSYGGNVVLPHIQQTMRNPKAWSWVYPMAVVTVTVLYLMIAISGYFVYGDETLSPIYNNLPDGWYKTLAIVVMTIHVLFTTPIFLTSFSLEVEEIFRIDKETRGVRGELLLRAIVRILAMAFVVLIAVSVPFFGDFMNLLGSLSEGLLTFVFPVAFYWKLYGWNHPPVYERIWGIAIIAVGIYGCILGTIESLEALHKDFNQ